MATSSRFSVRLRDAWRTLGHVNQGPRLSDDPRYAAMLAGQLTHPDAVEFGLVYGPVTVYEPVVAMEAVFVGP